MPKKYSTISYSFVIADLFHYGHLRLLKTAKENADYHICGIISDEVCHLWQGMNICNYEMYPKCSGVVQEVVPVNKTNDEGFSKPLAATFPVSPDPTR